MNRAWQQCDADRFHYGLMDIGFDLGDHELAFAGDKARANLQEIIDNSKKGYLPTMDDVGYYVRISHRDVYQYAICPDYREIEDHPKYEEFVEHLYDWFRDEKLQLFHSER